MMVPRDARSFVPFTPSLFQEITRNNPELVSPPDWGLSRLISSQWLPDRFKEDGRLANEGEEDTPRSSIVVDPAPWLVNLRGQVRYQIDNVPAFDHPESGPRLAYPPHGITLRYQALRYAQKDQGELQGMKDDDPSWQGLDDGYLADAGDALKHLDWTSTPRPLPHTPSPLLHAAVHLRVPRAPLLQRRPSEDVLKLRYIQRLRWRRVPDYLANGRIAPVIVQANRPLLEGLRPDDAWVSISLQALMTGLEWLLKNTLPPMDRDCERYLMDPVPIPAPGMVHDATPVVRYRERDDAPDAELGFVCVMASWVVERMDGTSYVAKPVALFIPGRMAWEIVAGALFAQEKQGAMLLHTNPSPQCGYRMDGEARRRFLLEGQRRRTPREDQISETDEPDETPEPAPSSHLKAAEANASTSSTDDSAPAPSAKEAAAEPKA